MPRILFSLLVLSIFSTSIFAQPTEVNLNVPITHKKPLLKPVISISVALANSHVAQTQNISVGSPAVQNSYQPNQTNLAQGLFSLFAGAEYSGNSVFNTQFGLGYYYTPSSNVTGTLQQSITTLANLYDYQYSISTQQLLAEAKLLFRWRKQILPYVSLGLGAALNHAGNYSATPQSDTAGPPPLFNAHDHTNFSYSLGLGVDMILQPQLRLGVGYRYSNLGTVSLAAQENSGALQNKNYYSNAVLATLTYLF